MKKLFLGLAALSVATAPVAASAVGVERAIAPAEGENIAGVPSVLIGILAAAAVIGGIVIASDDDDNDDLPVSG